MSQEPLFDFVRDGDRQFAVIVRQGAGDGKYNFATAPDSPLQLGVSFYAGGDEVAPHAHHPRESVIRQCQEFVLVQAGAVEVTIYREDGSRVRRFELGAGDAVLFQQGGHGLRCLGPTRILEIKQGPYVSRERDKYALASAAGPGPGR